MIYLLDTNVCIGVLKGHPGIVARLSQLTPAQVRLSAVVKAELCYGAWASENPAKNLSSLERFVAPYLSLPFDDACADQYGRLRRQGVPIGANDLLIAATALAHDLTLVTHNTREFGRVPHLRLEDWEA
ncbi:MAG: type II toxin-antitoxin system VapC family toxin [Truepera sp.]|nr:type II toxin-antitoxin system VapC family toxin [Truepera sp.]